MNAITANTLRRMNEPWLCDATTYCSMRQIIETSASVSEHQGYVDNSPPPQAVGDIAVVSLKGTMMRNPSGFEIAMLNATDTDKFTQNIRELANDDAVSAVVLDVDSPGGSVGGVMEAATAVRGLERIKPVISHTSGIMASAAYWVGSQGTIMMGDESSRVGSIGVYLPYVDGSELMKRKGLKVDIIKNKEGTFKGAGYFGTSLTTEQRGQIQAEVQEIFDDFSSAVQKKRNPSDDAMQGQTFGSKSAVNNRLIDLQGTFMDSLLMANAESVRRKVGS